jgi:hypothetical protein
VDSVLQDVIIHLLRLLIAILLGIALAFSLKGDDLLIKNIKYCQQWSSFLPRRGASSLVSFIPPLLSDVLSLTFRKLEKFRTFLSSFRFTFLSSSSHSRSSFYFDS